MHKHMNALVSFAYMSTQDFKITHLWPPYDSNLQHINLCHAFLIMRSKVFSLEYLPAHKEAHRVRGNDNLSANLVTNDNYLTQQSMAARLLREWKLRAVNAPNGQRHEGHWPLFSRIWYNIHSVCVHYLHMQLVHHKQSSILPPKQFSNEILQNYSW